MYSMHRGTSTTGAIQQGGFDDEQNHTQVLTEMFTATPRRLLHKAAPVRPGRTQINAEISLLHLSHPLLHMVRPNEADFAQGVSRQQETLKGKSTASFENKTLVVFHLNDHCGSHVGSS